MSDLRASVAWWCFEGTLPPDELIETAARLGFAGLEFVPPEHWSATAAAGLTITAIRGHESLTDGLNRRENHDRIERELTTNLDLARRWGIPNLICFSGNRDGLDDEEGAAATADGLRRVAAAAEDAGVTLVLELLNSRVDHPDYQADRTGWGARVCRLVDSPRVKLLYDVYHMQIMEGDIIRTIRAHHDSIGHYHVAGNPGRNEPDDRQELHYPAIYRAIAETGYAGFVGMEYLPTDDPAGSLGRAIAQTR